MTPELLIGSITLFVLAIFLGFELITKVPAIVCVAVIVTGPAKTPESKVWSSDKVELCVTTYVVASITGEIVFVDGIVQKTSLVPAPKLTKLFELVEDITVALEIVPVPVVVKA